MASLSLPPPRKSSGPSSVVVTTVGRDAPGISTATATAGSTSTTTSMVVVTQQGQQRGRQYQQGHNRNASERVLRAPNYEARCRAAAEVARMSQTRGRNGNGNKNDNNKQNNKPPKLFVPRALEDFDDGGAFPEIHVAQYPRHMGNPHLKRGPSSSSGSSSSSGATSGRQTTSRAIVNVEVDQNGEVSYDAIVKGGTNSDRKVYTRYEDLKGGEAKAEDVALPTEDEEQETTDRTQAALQKLLDSKNALNKPSGSAMVNAETSKNIEEKTQFIKYTPRPDAPGYNPAAAKRVIQMVPAQVDPMMPPKHKHIKAPRGPAEDPVPILHAPPPKLTKEERDKWNIPACISNWKNTRGYTIPLDKRLAADGRGLREHTINSNFATLSESLYVAERQARQEVRMRAQVQKKLTLQEKDRREEELRQLANQARLERSGLMTGGGGGSGDGGDDNTTTQASATDETNHNDNGKTSISDSHRSDDERDGNRQDDDNNRNHRGRVQETDDMVAARQREKLRAERRRERERDLRQQNNMELKKRKLEAERDVSEKIALGVHTGNGGGAGGGEVDARLYSQTSGMDSGFGADDEYNTYSKPLFDRQGVTSASIYRPTRGETQYNADESYDKLVKGSTSKFQPARGFAGAEGGTDIRAGPRSAPVQFEKGKK